MELNILGKIVDDGEIILEFVPPKLKEWIEELQEEIQELSETVDILERKQNKLLDDIDELKEDKDKVESENDELEMQNRDYGKFIAYLEEQIEELKIKLNEK